MLSSQAGLTTTNDTQSPMTHGHSISASSAGGQSETERNSALVDRDGQILTINPHFERALAAQDALALQSGALLPAAANLHTEWLRTLRHVLRTGEGCLFKLPQTSGTTYVAIVPSEHAGIVGVRLPQSRLCPSGTVVTFASLIGLTPRETLVMDKITQGLPPVAIAGELATRESTVRTQVKSILAKSNHHSVRELLITLGRLPSTTPATAPDTPLTTRSAAAHSAQLGNGSRTPAVSALNVKHFPS